MKILIAYYSFSGITKTIAKTMSKLINADDFEILPQIPYSFDYNTALKEAREQINSGYSPKLIGTLPNTQAYEQIFIGSPNWLGTFAPPILTFIKNSSLKDKIIVPFCSHGGGSFGQIYDNIVELCPNSKVLPILSILSDSSEEYIKEVLGKRKFI